MAMKHDHRKFLAWLKVQPGELQYDWRDPAECLIGRFITDTGRESYYYPDHVPDYYEIAAPTPWTMGAALKRARDR
jgi:hypothetical protein